MSRRFSEIVPKSPNELERFYLDTIDKLKGTTSSLADEEKKSTIPFLSLVQDLSFRIETLEHDKRSLRILVNNLEQRITDLEGQI